MENHTMNIEPSPTPTPRDGNCLIHAITDSIMNNDALRHNGKDELNETWSNLLKDLKIYDEGDNHLLYLRTRWARGAANALAGGEQSKQNDKADFKYTDKEWAFMWRAMMVDGAWALPSIKDEFGNRLKENLAPEMFIKYVAHDIQCHIIVFDLLLGQVQFCSANHLKDGNVKFDSPILLYSTGSHFQAVFQKDQNFFIQYACELEERNNTIPAPKDIPATVTQKTSKEDKLEEENLNENMRKEKNTSNNKGELTKKEQYTEEYVITKTNSELSEEEKKELKRQKERERKRKQRGKKKDSAATKTKSDLTEEEKKELKKVKERERKRKQREEEAPDTRTKRNEKERERKKKQIENETPENNIERKRKHSDYKKNCRSKMKLKTGKHEGKATEVDISKFRENDHHLEDYDISSGSFEKNRKCGFCHALLFKTETSSFCCSNGKVKISENQKIKPVPSILKTLMKSKDFLKNIRAYNNIMAMASLGTDHQPEFGPNFKVQGKLSHRIGSLLPEPGQTPKFAQMYFHDADHELNNRLDQNQELDENVVRSLQSMLHQINPYVHSFKSALDLGDIGEYRLCIIAERSKMQIDGHKRTYNLPDGCEVAALLPGDIGNLDVIITTKGGVLKRINQLNRCYDPLHYVLLFPYGEDGYQLGLQRTTNKTLSPKDFYCFRFQMRCQDDDDHILHCGKLTQQYFVDSQAKVEQCRLNWVSQNQTVIRSEKYKGLLDAVAVGDGNNIGKRVILPSTITGSPRWYAERFQDAMTMVREFGKPDYFVTFTCNPLWKEIQDSILPTEIVYDRPDVIARVFKEKLECMMKLLLSEHVLGRIEAYFYTIEWQKRKGLPHAHILIIMETENKPKTAEAIDKVVSAEIPNKKNNPKLYEIIARNNIHGPCGKCFNERSYCLEKTSTGKLICSKDFPKDCQKETQVIEGGYPVYRRRSEKDGGIICKMERKKEIWNVDNSWVIPYNPLISLLFDAHVNFEVVLSVVSVKYLYKYVTKGPDRAIFKVERETGSVDEVENFQNGRYLGAGESAWKIFGFQLHNKSHTIEKLPCHLENEQLLTFSEDSKAEELVSDGPPVTKLTAYFLLNQEDHDANVVLYPDIPKYYVWEDKSKKWKKRQRGGSKVIGRIPSIGINATQLERYCLRLLLFKVPGSKSYDDLKTVEGKVLETFQAACFALGFLEDDKENDKVMEEASLISFGDLLIDCFVNLLLFSTPPQPKEFYSKHKQSMIADFLKSEHGNEEKAEERVLTKINARLEYENKNLDFFGLPKLQKVSNVPALIKEEMSYDIVDLEEKTLGNISKMNAEQLTLYNNIMSSVRKEEGRIFCVCAAGGTGKSFVNNTCLFTVRSEGKVAIATALSALAATLLQNGATLHSKAKLPIPINQASVCNFGRNDVTGKLFQMCKLLIIDEVTMGDKLNFEALDRSLKDIRKDERTFGGLTVLFTGDWRQILPVVPRGSRSQIINCCLKNSYLWEHVEVFTLTQNMRVSHDENIEAREFADLLLSIGDGTLNDEDGYIHIDPTFFSKAKALTEFCEEIFSGINNGLSEIDGKAILCPTNAEVKEVNRIVLDMLEGDKVEFVSNDTLIDEGSSHQYPVEFLNSIDLPSMPPHCLQIKRNAIIMLLVNLDQRNGHCNGTRYQVMNISKHVLEAIALNGKAEGKKLIIPRINFLSKDTQFPFQMKRKQFPVRLSYAITANKSQGQTLKFVGIYLGTEFFSHGQVYVSLSRVKDRRNILIFRRDKEKKMKNIVFQEIL